MKNNDNERPNKYITLVKMQENGIISPFQAMLCCKGGVDGSSLRHPRLQSL